MLNKVILSLRGCLGGGCSKCYYKPKGYSAMDCRNKLMSDALKLLEEYKAIKPLIDDISDQIHETAKEFRK